MQGAADEDKVAVFETPILDILNSWTEKPGYPVITVAVDSTNSLATVSQV